MCRQGTRINVHAIPLVRFEEVLWRSFNEELSALASSNWPQLDGKSELLGLPLELEVQRRLANRQADDDRKRLEMEARRQIETDNRVAEFQRLVSSQLGPEHKSWIDEPCNDCDGLSPALAAATGGARFAKAKRALNSFERQLREAAREGEEHKRQRDLLREAVQSCCRRLDITEAWMTGTNPKLRMRRPVDFCTNDQIIICR